MKVSYAVIAIIGILAAVGAYWGIQSKLDYDQIGRDIDKAILEYHALGIATNHDAFVKKVPDDQNAWIDLEPLLLGADYHPDPIKQGDVMALLDHQRSLDKRFPIHVEQALLFGGERSDLNLIREVGKANEPIRRKIVASLQAKSQIQFSQGSNADGVLYTDERNALRRLIADLCFAAFAASLENNKKGVALYLGKATRLTNFFTDQNNWLDLLGGDLIRKQVLQASLRIVQVSPPMLDAVQSVMLKPDCFAEPNHGRILRTEFVSEIESIRYLDMPQMDESNPRFPFNKILPARKWPNLAKNGRSREGDYIPQSRFMRKYLLSMLQAWKPILADLAKADQRYRLSAGSLRSVAIAARKVNDPLRETLGEDGVFFDEQFAYETLDHVSSKLLINRLVWKLFEIRKKKGHFPPDLAALGPETNSEARKLGVLYSPQSGGFVLKTVATSGSHSTPLFRIIYPSIVPRGSSSVRATIDKFRIGKIDLGGNELDENGKAK